MGSAVLSIPVAAVGIAAAQLVSEHGFGHNAGSRAVAGATLAAFAIALVWPFVG